MPDHIVARAIKGNGTLATHAFHPTVLREYDIRGIVGETLHKDDALAIGKAFGTIAADAGGKDICVGFDGRLSSPMLADALCDGLMAAGIDVIRIGVGPTPMLYFAVHHFDADGGIQVTGSHNPPSHNGFKMMLGKTSFFGEQIKNVGKIAAAGDWLDGQGSSKDADIFDIYVERLLQDFTPGRELSVVWDAGNGAAGPAMAALAARLPGKHTCLFADIDGHFPNHHPDPTVPENLVDLTREVVDGGYELGIGFDGDGDRIGVIDGGGRIIWGDQILQILAADILKRYPGAPIIADVKASEALFDKIEQLGGKPVMWKTGHSLIKDKMIELSAPLSGEMSGHIFYKDRFYGHDDALYVAIRLLGILASGDKTLAEWRDDMAEMVNTPEIRFECDDVKKFEYIETIKQRLRLEGARVDETDGVRVSTQHGWWLLRASNTQSVLVARAEASSETDLELLKEQIKSHLSALGLSAPQGF